MAQQFTTVRVKVAGQHHWPDAPDLVAFLRHPHRHVFTFEVSMWTGPGREREFFHVQRDLLTFLSLRFGRAGLLTEFGERSCEDLALIVLNEFDTPTGLNAAIGRVIVWEDDENAGGAVR